MKQSTYEKYCLVVDEWFINGWNGTKAYQKYYPDATDESADSSFRDIVGISRIQDYISKKKETALQSLKTSHEALLKELENWAYSDITETLSLSEEEVKQLPSEIRRLITSYKKTTVRYGKDNENEKTTIELKFVSKERAMEMIHKHVGFYELDNAQKSQPMTPEQRRAEIEQLKKELGVSN